MDARKSQIKQTKVENRNRYEIGQRRFKVAGGEGVSGFRYERWKRGEGNGENQVKTRPKVVGKEATYVSGFIT